VPYLIEALLFLAPFAAFFIWRRLNPGREPGTVLLVLSPWNDPGFATRYLFIS
jgi:hypothetical protein